MPRRLMSWLVFVGLVMAAGTLGVLAWGSNQYGDVVARTMGMTTFALFRLFSSLETADEDESLFGGSILANRPLLLATGLSVLTIILATEFGFLQRLLGHDQPDGRPVGHLHRGVALAHRGRGGAQVPQDPRRLTRWPPPPLPRPHSRHSGQTTALRCTERRGTSVAKKKDKKAEKDRAVKQQDDAEVGAAPTEPSRRCSARRTRARCAVSTASWWRMQEWVKATGAKVCVVFEGRDTAGKGGTIKRITERVSPRVFKVVALSAPTERERSQMYVQRYIAALPGGR